MRRAKASVFQRALAGSRYLAQICRPVEQTAKRGIEFIQGRRLGYLLDLAEYARQTGALRAFVKHAKTALPLDPAVKPLGKTLAQTSKRNAKWKLPINEAVQIAE